MMYKKLAAFVMVLVTIFNTANAQTKIGVKAGVIFSNVMMKSETGEKVNTQAKPGVDVGLTLDIPLLVAFAIQPGISYSSKGFKQEADGFYGYAINFNVKAEYLEIPKKQIRILNGETNRNKLIEIDATNAEEIEITKKLGL